MNDGVFVSIIVPVYNVEDYLAECLMSLKNQSLKNIEVVIVDDGSTDNSLKIIRGFCEADNRFRFFKQTRQGQSSARNKGVLEALGEYILFVDADDWIDKKTCELLYLKAFSDDLDVVVYGYFYVFKDREILRDNYFFFEKKTGFEYLTKSLENGKITFPACNKLIKRTLARQIHFRYGYIHEDIEYVFSLLSKAEIVSTVKFPLYFYRRFRSGSTSSDIRMKNISDIIDIFSFVENNLNMSSKGSSIVDSGEYKVVKYQKIIDETLFKFIDDSRRCSDVNDMICFLLKNKELMEGLGFYILNGNSLKHKFAVFFFKISPSLYLFLGRTFYPILKKIGLAS